MKFSEKWLREWVNPSLSAKALGEKLTMAGMEIDSIQEEGDDTLIEVELTPNRGDCLSIQGIAREISVLTDMAITQLPPTTLPPIQDELTFKINIDAPKACSRYIGRIVQGIRPTATTPTWLQERLTKSDIGCIHPVVDILNYVMLELGQPMHAFDRDKIQDPISVREARGGEELLLLDDKTVTLQANTLVIADSANVLAIAGIMGGRHSAVSETTQNIILESAFFTPHLIAGKARIYGLHTDSSARFERGVDPELQKVAMERATALICEYCGGKPGPLIEQVSAANLPKREWLTLSYTRLTKLLGYSIDYSNVVNILEKLGCVVEPIDQEKEKMWRVLPPSFRGDILAEVDLIEEIVRIFGYDKIPTTMPLSHLQFAPYSSKKMRLARLKRALVDMGYQEVITYSFVDDILQKQLFSEDALALVNPISAEMNVMRLSLWPGLLTTLKYNQNRRQHRMRIFETGLRFQKKGEAIQQDNMLAGLIAGDFSSEHWNMPKRPVDFFDIKNTITSLWAMIGQSKPLVFEAASHSACHPGQCANILWQGEAVGVLGRLHPKIEKALDLQGPIYLFEVRLDIFNHIPQPVFERPSRFPEIRRDIAIIVDERLSSDSLISYVRKSACELLRDIQVFDVYTGKGIDSGRKSIALGLILQHPSRTLVDKEVDEIIHTIVIGLEKEFSAKLRD